MAENTIIFMVIIQFVALTTCTLVGLACKAIHRLIGHSIEEIKLQFVGPQDWEEMEWAEVPYLFIRVHRTVRTKPKPPDRFKSSPEPVFREI